jgi:hypothetical protein
MSSIFPSIQPEIEETASEQLPLCREIAWNFTDGTPIFSGGRPVVVTGAEAVKVWAWKALNTVRCRHDIYTWDYGCEAERLIGKGFTAQVQQSEAVRYVREALLPNPYITDVRQVAVSFSEHQLSVICAVSTIYGEVSVNV